LEKNEVNNETSDLEGLVSGKDLIQAFKKNTVKYTYKKIVPQDIQSFQDEGWEKIGRGNKKSLRLRKLKDIPVGFEDEVWCIFYKMGFDEMNKDHDFSIT
jgi:DNA sulfur modification protein DndB